MIEEEFIIACLNHDTKTVNDLHNHVDIDCSRFMILYLYDKGPDFFKDNQNISVLDVLLEQENLSEKLQALKEKLILENEIDEEDDSQMINKSAL